MPRGRAGDPQRELAELGHPARELARVGDPSGGGGRAHPVLRDRDLEDIARVGARVAQLLLDRIKRLYFAVRSPRTRAPVLI